MFWTDKHIKWLKKDNKHLKTIDGKHIQIWHFDYDNDYQKLSEWAKHFRNHYSLDTEIDELRDGTGKSRKEYLLDLKFPDKVTAPGPSIRSGDFGEILIADFLEFILKHWVPRNKFADKDVRNESKKGCDIIGFKFEFEDKLSINDILTVFEVKSQFTGKEANPRLQDAIDDSGKDYLRKAETLNAYKQRFVTTKMTKEKEKVQRFQNMIDNPYKEQYCAAALFDKNIYNETTISNSTTENHPNNNNMILIVISGIHMMELVHSLYERAADEA